MPFFTAGIQFIFGQPGLQIYGATNILVLDASIDSLVGETLICRATLGIGEESKNVTIVQARKSERD